MGEKEIRQLSLTIGQRELWIGQTLNPQSPLYNMAICCTIHGIVDPERMVRAWNDVVLCNDILRTCIVLDDGEPKQKILSASTLSLVLHDTSTEPDPLANAHTWIQSRVETQLPMSKIMVEAALIKISASKWIWFCNQHHLITDATSFVNLWQQLCVAYETDSTLANANVVPSADYHQYVMECQKTDTPDSVANYWRNLHIPAPVTFYGRGGDPTDTSSTRVNGLLDAHRGKAFDSLASQSEVRSLNIHLTRFQLLMTALIAYVYRASGQSTIAVAAPAPNRLQAQFRNTLGLFVELLPMSIEVAPNDSFRDLFTKVRHETLNYLKHAQPNASANIPNRQVSVVLNYVPLSMDALDEMPVTTQWLHSGHADSHHLMRMHVTDWNDSGSLSIACDFNDACFDDRLRESACLHWQSILDALLQDMDQIIDHVDIIRYDEHARSAHNALVNAVDSSAEKNVGDNVFYRFEQSVERFPTDTAVSEGDRSLTYFDLHTQALSVSRALAQQGIGAGDVVGVLLHRSIGVPGVLLGILHSGAAYLPIETTTPNARIDYLVKDAGACCVVTEPKLQAHVSTTVPLVLIDPLDPLEMPQTERVADPKIGDITDQNQTSGGVLRGKSTAYILYTSGSTGNPKGVVVSHAAMLNYCSWAADYYCDGERLVFPLFTPLGFDLTVTSLFVPLISGGQIRIYPQQHQSYDETLLHLIDEDCVDIVKLTPAHLSLLQDKNLSHSRIKQLIVGGEDLKCALAGRVHQAFDGKVVIHNEYGPTEATVGCIVHRFDPVNEITGSVPIGKPVAGMAASVLNAGSQCQPVGLIGRLYLSGPSLADGYWGQTAMTAEHFVPCADSGQIKYHTGDLVYINPDGDLVFKGRKDAQIKVNGARVELAEIESAALSHPDVTDCVAIAIPAEAPATSEQRQEQYCTRCGISSWFPDIDFDAEGICSICNRFEKYKDQAEAWFKTTTELEALAADVRDVSTGRYDCMVLLSGGKDSTYALAKLADLGLSILAFTLDNGYLSDAAKTNIAKVCEALNVDHEYGRTPAMREIFADSLSRYSNVCNGCFKTIYTLSMLRARELDIGLIFTGLSRGQFFETRLTEELLNNPEINSDAIDEVVLSARKAYHRAEDTVSRVLDTRAFGDDSLFEEVRIVDFYRYCDVGLEDMLNWLQQRLPWVRPSDTGRSTNCLINDVGIYVHKRERGYHNYALPYSWDVRLGHKQRDAALEELDDHIDVNGVNAILDELEYVCEDALVSSGNRLALYYVADSALSEEQLRLHSKNHLPEWMVPHWLVSLSSLPLNENGKIQRDKLPNPLNQVQSDSVDYVPPSSDFEQLVAELWCQHLKLNSVGIHDNFFRLGGDSLTAIRIAAQLNKSGFAIDTADLFEHQTIAELDKLKESDRTVRTTQTDVPSKTPAAFGLLRSGQLEKLSQLIKKNDE